VQPIKPHYQVVVQDERLVSHARVGLLAELADRVAGDRAPRPSRRGGPGQAAHRSRQRTSAGVAAGAAPPGRWILDLDATLIEAHSDAKQGAAPHYQGGFGFHPLGCWLDRGDGRGEPLAVILGPGNAGANDAADHIQVLTLALAQLPTPPRGRRLLVRSDSAGCSHELLWHLHQHHLRFSVGWPIDAHAKDAMLGLPASAWVPAINPDGSVRDGAWVAEATGHLDLAGWPPGTRAICRKERPHESGDLEGMAIGAATAPLGSAGSRRVMGCPFSSVRRCSCEVVLVSCVFRPARSATGISASLVAESSASIHLPGIVWHLWWDGTWFLPQSPASSLVAVCPAVVVRRRKSASSSSWSSV
jgi:hypothetical protein